MRTQIHILDASNEGDRALVERILVSASTKFGIADTTVTSRVPDTIRCYSEHVGFAIGGRVVGGMVIVDFYSGKAPSSDFPVIQQSITLELRRVFGDRIRIPNESEYIAAQSTLPESEAARAFHCKHFKY